MSIELFTTLALNRLQQLNGNKTSFYPALFFLASLAAAFGQSSVEHEIVSRRTIYGLAKEYSSTVEAIYEANPNIGVRNLVIGDILIIPILKKRRSTLHFTSFTRCAAFESVCNSVANKYELKDSTIFWHNPVLEGSAILQKDKILRIPKDPDGWRKRVENLTRLYQTKSQNTRYT